MPINQYSLDTDIVIFGGGIAGSAIAHQAVCRKKRVIVLENQRLGKNHYATGLLAPRADYLLRDLEEVKETIPQLRLWQNLLPKIIKPELFLLLFNPNTPYNYEAFKALMKYYDEVTKDRLSFLPSGHFELNRKELEEREPNLRKKYLTGAIGFYELTTPVDQLITTLWERTTQICTESEKIFVDIFSGYAPDIRNNRLKDVFVIDKEGNNIKISNSRGELVVVNTGGPWLEENFRVSGLKMPFKYQIGFQAKFNCPTSIKSSLLFFGYDKKYLICRQFSDHLQVGPTTNKEIERSKVNEALRNEDNNKNALEELSNSFYGIMDLKFIKYQGEIKSAGARVKLDLSNCPDSNRPFIAQGNYNNYFMAYPGKIPMALAMANDLLDRLDNRKIWQVGGYKHSLDLSDRKNIIRTLILAKIKSIFSFMLFLLRNPQTLINIFKSPIK